jgi:hypothetical protein
MSYVAVIHPAREAAQHPLPVQRRIVPRRLEKWVKISVSKPAIFPRNFGAVTLISPQ